MTMQGGMSAGGRKLGLALIALGLAFRILIAPGLMPQASPEGLTLTLCTAQGPVEYRLDLHKAQPEPAAHDPCPYGALAAVPRSEEHTSELQSLMRISYAVFCLKKKKDKKNSTKTDKSRERH